jgi:DNA-directed RNA polymerase subunit RPC12/RpoP
MGVLHQTDKLQCPYAMCKKTFEKPLVLTDNTQLIRETYYACPHCRSKIEIDVKDPLNPQLASVQDTFYSGQKAPKYCDHYLGYLQNLSETSEIPDECAICPRVMQCFVKKDST